MTTVNCTNCGAEILGAAFCGGCGTAAPTPVPAVAATGSPDGPTASAAAAVATVTAPSVAASPAAGIPGLPGMPPGPTTVGTKPAGAGKGKAIGMGVTALIGVVALLKVFTGGDDPTTVPQQPQDQTQPAGPAQPAQPAQPAEPVIPGGTAEPEQQAQGGGLRDFITDPVGEFQLAQGGQLTEYIENGALDAYQLVYQSPDGRQVVHVLAALPDPNTALSAVHRLVQGLQEQGYQLQEQGDVVIDGQKAGEAFVLAGQETVIAWSNGQLFAFVSGPGDAPGSFYQQIPY